MELVEFEEFTSELLENLAARTEVIGLVLMGSTADRSRHDEWSDHDFPVVTESGMQDSLKSDLGWLPRFEKLVLCAIDPEEGFKAFYENGHVLELDVASLEELLTWHGNDYDVVLDRGGVAEAMATIAAKEKPSALADAERDIRIFLTLLLVGVGRARRGEVLIAGAAIRSAAVSRLVDVWRLRIPGDRPERLDSLESRRRFELVYPEAGRVIGDALEADVETAARKLLDLAERGLAAGWEAFPRDAAAALRKRLGWDTQNGAE
jgi:hypothetical protein